MTTTISNTQIAQIANEFHTPCWAYDASIIRQQIARLKQFDVIRFAQKASSNIHLLRLMREQGVMVDSVSLGEVERALAAGYAPTANADQTHAPIVFTADLLDRNALKRVVELNIPVNCGSPNAGTAWTGTSRASGLAAYQSRFWSWPQPQNQYRRRTKQTRHLV
jgi:diaminopimelate decarboxylase